MHLACSAQRDVSSFMDTELQGPAEALKLATRLPAAVRRGEVVMQTYLVPTK
jgi:hypothetical protein